jgi:hypothetical protein
MAPDKPLQRKSLRFIAQEVYQPNAMRVNTRLRFPFHPWNDEQFAL